MEWLYDILNQHVSATCAGIVIAICTLFEVSKIPLNPWSTVVKMFKKALSSAGDALTKDIKEQLVEIRHDLTELKTDYTEEKKKNLRRSILRFADECRLKREHSKEMFNHVLKDIDEYKVICRETSDPNSVIDEAIQIIKEANHICNRDNRYL